MRRSPISKILLSWQGVSSVTAWLLLGVFLQLCAAETSESCKDVVSIQQCSACLSDNASLDTAVLCDSWIFPLVIRKLICGNNFRERLNRLIAFVYESFITCTFIDAVARHSQIVFAVDRLRVGLQITHDKPRRANPRIITVYSVQIIDSLLRTVLVAIETTKSPWNKQCIWVRTCFAFILGQSCRGSPFGLSWLGSYHLLNDLLAVTTL